MSNRRKCDVCGQVDDQPAVQRIVRARRGILYTTTLLHSTFRCLKCIEGFKDSLDNQPESTFNWREEKDVDKCGTREAEES